MMAPVPRENASEADDSWNDLASTLSEDLIGGVSLAANTLRCSRFSSAHKGDEGAATKKWLPKGALLHLAGKPDDFVALCDVILVVEVCCSLVSACSPTIESCQTAQRALDCISSGL